MNVITIFEISKGHEKTPFLKRYADDQHGSQDLGKGHGNIQCDMQSIFKSAIVF